MKIFRISNNKIITSDTDLEEDWEDYANKASQPLTFHNWKYTNLVEFYQVADEDHINKNDIQVLIWLNETLIETIQRESTACLKHFGDEIKPIFDGMISVTKQLKNSEPVDGIKISQTLVELSKFRDKHDDIQIYEDDEVLSVNSKSPNYMDDEIPVLQSLEEDFKEWAIQFSKVRKMLKGKLVI